MVKSSFRRLLETLTPKPDILALTEKWMTENDTLEEFQIDGYQPIVSNPRKKIYPAIRRGCFLYQRRHGIRANRTFH